MVQQRRLFLELGTDETLISESMEADSVDEGEGENMEECAERQVDMGRVEGVGTV